jgi:hypothetical protein
LRREEWYFPGGWFQKSIRMETRLGEHFLSVFCKMWKNFGKFRRKIFKHLEDSISLLLDNLGEESPPQGPDLNNIEHLWIYLIRNKKSIKTTSRYNFVNSGEFIARICHAFFAIFLQRPVQLLSSVLRYLPNVNDEK